MLSKTLQIRNGTAYNNSLHLKSIYAEDELSESTTTEDFSVVQREGSREVQRKVKHYNLDALIAVGYRYTHLCERQFYQKTTDIYSTAMGCNKTPL
jgi:hypothetical protein